MRLPRTEDGFPKMAMQAEFLYKCSLFVFSVDPTCLPLGSSTGIYILRKVGLTTSVKLCIYICISMYD